LSLVSLQTGQQFQNTNDAYSNHLFDEQTQEFWRDMTNAERLASSTNTGNLTWRGPNADNNSSHLNAISRTNGNIRMFAPNPVEPGSSVSHWDTILSPDELMEPSATLTSDARSTIQLGFYYRAWRDWLQFGTNFGKWNFRAGSYSDNQNRRQRWRCLSYN